MAEKSTGREVDNPPGETMKKPTGREVDNPPQVEVTKKSTTREVDTPIEGEVRKKLTAAPSSPTWAALFKDNRRIENGLKLKEWKEGDREIEEQDLTKVEDSWGICLVGYILGRFPGRKAIDEVRNAWGVKHHFYIHQSGWMVFKFNCEEDKERVISNGPYNTYGTPWLLKDLPPFFKFGDDCLNSIPTWIKLPSLPLECWNDVVLGKIVSNVGKPISTDQCTALRSRPGFARVLVEVDINKPLVEEVRFKLPNGDEICQQIVFEHPPILCKSCNRIGHGEAVCKRDRVPARRRSLSMGKRGGKVAGNMVQGGDKKSGAPVLLNGSEPSDVLGKKSVEDAKNSKPLMEEKKGGDRSCQNVGQKKAGLVKEKTAALVEKLPAKGVQFKEQQGEVSLLNLRPQVPSKNKGKMVMENQGENQEVMVSKKLIPEASSSNIRENDVNEKQDMVAGIFKLPIREKMSDDSEEDEDESVGKAERIGRFFEENSRSLGSAIAEMGTEEELHVLEEEMGLRPILVKKDIQQGKGKNRGRSRRK